jgi:hypothetical protein
MNENDGNKPSSRSTFRRLRFISIGLGSLILLLVVSWVLFNQYLRIDSYRPAFEAKLSDVTGLPVSIGKLGLSLRPLPVIRADTVAIGKDSFRLNADEGIIEPDLQDLLHRDIHITAITLQKLIAVVPADPAELRQRFGDIAKRMGQSKGGKIQFSLDHLHAKGATLFVGTAQQPVFTGDLDFHDVLSPTPSGRIDAAVIALRDRVKASGDFRLTRGPGGKGIQAFKGSFSMEGLDVAKVVEKPKAPRVSIQVDGAFSGTNPQNLTVNLAGNVAAEANAKQLGESLEGPFTAKAIWDGTTVRLEDLRWKAAGLELAGDVTRTDDGAYRISIPQGAIGHYTLNPVFAMLPASTYRLAAAKSASIALENFAASVPREGGPRLEQGRVTLVGIDVLNAKKEPIAKNVKGVLVCKDGKIQVEGLEGAGLNVTGTIEPDYKAKAAKIDLAGTFALSRESLRPLMSVERIPDVGGSVKLKRIAGTFGQGKGLPKDFVLEGSTEDAYITLDAKEFKDVLKPISATFTTQGKTVDMKAGAQSQAMGTLRAEGRYTVETRAWDGTFTADVPKVALVFLKSDAAKKRVPPLLEPYGESTFNLNATLPTEKEKRIGLRLARKGDPALNAELELLPKQGGGYSLGGLTSTATLPVSAGAAFLPPNTVADGNAEIKFVRALPDQTFRADIILDKTAMTFNDYLRKPTDVPATVTITGEASVQRWAAKTLTLAVADQTASGEWQENRLVFPDLNLDAAKLSVLLARNAQATGTIRGRFYTAPTEADLVLQNVAFTYKPEVGVESVNGRVAYSGGRLGLDNVSVHGANSTASLALVRENEAWTGTVKAEQLDINRILELQKAARTQSGGEAKPASTEASKSGGFKGRVALQADRFLYRNAELTNVRADITGEGNRILIQNASLHPAEGIATVDATVARENSGAPWVVEGKANLKEASAALLDGLLFKEPRGFTGKVDGDIAFRVPLIPDQPAVNNASATATLVAHNGSFGKMGVATKVLNVLRSAEIFRLRLPSMSDQGLTYDTAHADIKMTDGVMQVNKVEVERPSFKLTADGEVNFPKDDMRVEIHVHPFETVTGLAEKVPVVGSIVGGLKDLTPVGLVARGSPYNPSVTPGNVLKAERGAEKPVEAGEQTPVAPEDQPQTETAQAEPGQAPESVPDDKGLGKNARRIVRGILGR